MSRLLALLFVVVLSGCSGFEDLAGPPEVVKSPNDPLDYRYLELDNGLKALLVSDPQADKAAAALDVFVGSAYDPLDRQGLAHFLEHMLFLGTDKYPDSGEYQAFISEHGGRHNAYTSFRHTNYFFDIDPVYFDEGLDRFSRFFVAPLFNKEYVEREKHAVHSEYQARIKNDSRRQWEVLQQFMNPSHPVTTFSVGSLETLADRPGAPVREALLDFYEAYYSADRMALAVVAPASLDVLEARVRELFGPVPRRSAAELDIAAPLFAPGQLPAVAKIEPVKELRELALIFPVADELPLYREKPLAYLANLIGHEGQDSLLALLKREGYAEGLAAGPGISDGKQSSFHISINLTPRGERHWPKVAELVFDYIELIRSEGIEAWRHIEQGRLADIQFRFVEKTQPIQYVSQLASQLQDYPVADILRGPYRMDRYREELIRDILDDLVADNVLLAVTAPGVETDKVSRNYQAAYASASVDEPTLNRWSSAARDARLKLPKQNPYVPETFSLIERTDQPLPRLVDTPGYALWFAPDTAFNVPKVQLRAAYRTPVIDTARGAAMTALLLSVVEENLKSESYPAALAGLGYSFNLNADGFGFSVGGFGDKLQVLLANIVSSLQTSSLEAATVARVREELARNWRNSTKRDPYRQVMSKVPEIMEATHYDPLQMADLLQPVTVGELAAFRKRLFDGAELTVMAGGNLTEQQAIELAEPAASLMKRAEASGSDSSRAVFKLEQPVVREVLVDHDDTALIRYYQGRSDALEEQARLMVLRQLLKAPFFNQLRTEQQLGYVVAAIDLTMDRVPGIGLLVQSPVADRAKIETAMETFLQEFSRHLETMTDADLQAYRAAVITNLRQKPKNLRERIARDWNAVDLQHFNFDAREQMITAAAGYSLDEVRADFKALFLRDGRWLQVVTSRAESDTEAQPFEKSYVLPAG